MSADCASATIEIPPLDLVAASLLRLGADAKAARLFRTLGPGTGVQELAVALEIPPADVKSEVDRARRRAAAALECSRQLGIVPLAAGTPAYPEWLGQIVDPPIVLWTRGDWTALSRPGVAIVGSRRPSVTGATLAERLASGLALKGLVLTSGLATGIDGAAHRGALSAAGVSVGVLGSGPDVIYPGQHARLADELLEKGCLVSELPPGTGPRPHHFPLRNRIISGLSRAIVVVEAAERSGSLITARMALEQGRGVCAVPGSVVSGCHKGCHALIKDGARLVETVEDVLEELGWTGSGSPGSHTSKSLFSSDLLNTMIPGTPVTLDELAARIPRGGPEILGELATLELDGRVRRVPGGWFVRVD